MSKVNIALAGIAIVVIVLVLGASSLVKGITKTPETFTVGEQFIARLADDDLDGATALAISDLQNDTSKASLQTFVDDHADLFTSSTQVKFTGRGVNNDIRYAYGTISSNGTESPIYMEFKDENGETRVSYFSFNQEDIPNYSSDDNATANE